MRKVMFAMAMLGILASVAGAATLGITVVQQAGTSPTISSSVRAISNDGRFVAGAEDRDTGSYPMFWDVTTGNLVQVRGRGLGYFTGVDSESAVANKIGFGGMAGGTPGPGRNGWDVVDDATAPATGTLRDQDSNSSAGVTGAYNTVAATSAGTDAWLVGTREVTKGNQGYVWMTNAGSSNPVRTITGTGRVELQSVASVGTSARVVGWDNSGNRAIYADTTGNALAIPLVPGGTGNGQGKGISPDGSLFTGYMSPDPSVSDRTQGFIWTYGAANAVMLKPAGGDAAMGPAATEQSVAFDITNDGVAVGYTWRSDTNNDGCIWLPGDLVAKRLIEWLPTIGVSVAGWSDLSTAIGIASLGNGQYALVGDGTYNGTARGYYIVIPEPATMGLLALGGLAMLRRRR